MNIHKILTLSLLVLTTSSLFALYQQEQKTESLMAISYLNFQEKTSFIKAFETQNLRTVENIARLVRSRGNRASDLSTVIKVEKLRQLNQSFLQKLDTLSWEICEYEHIQRLTSNTIDKNDIPVKATNAQGLKHIMHSYQDELLKFIRNNMESYNREEMKSIATIYFKKYDILFEEFPQIVVLDNIQKCKLKLLQIEKQLLYNFSAEVSVEDQSCAQAFEIIAIPSKSTVKNGEVYEAEMFLIEETITPSKMYCNNKNVETNNGKGKVSFQAIHDDFGTNTSIVKYWEAKIVLQTPIGDTAFTKNIEYRITK